MVRLQKTVRNITKGIKHKWYGLVTRHKSNVKTITWHCEKEKKSGRPRKIWLEDINGKRSQRSPRVNTGERLMAEDRRAPQLSSRSEVE